MSIFSFDALRAHNGCVKLFELRDVAKGVSQLTINGSSPDSAAASIKPRSFRFERLGGGSAPSARSTIPVRVLLPVLQDEDEEGMGREAAARSRRTGGILLVVHDDAKIRVMRDSRTREDLRMAFQDVDEQILNEVWNYTRLYTAASTILTSLRNNQQHTRPQPTDLHLTSLEAWPPLQGESAQPQGRNDKDGHPPQQQQQGQSELPDVAFGKSHGACSMPVGVGSAMESLESLSLESEEKGWEEVGIEGEEWVLVGEEEQDVEERRRRRSSEEIESAIEPINVPESHAQQETQPSHQPQHQQLLSSESSTNSVEGYDPHHPTQTSQHHHSQQESNTPDSFGPLDFRAALTSNLMDLPEGQEWPALPSTASQDTRRQWALKGKVNHGIEDGAENQTSALGRNEDDSGNFMDEYYLTKAASIRTRKSVGRKRLTETGKARMAAKLAKRGVGGRGRGGEEMEG